MDRVFVWVWECCLSTDGYLLFQLPFTNTHFMFGCSFSHTHSHTRTKCVIFWSVVISRVKTCCEKGVKYLLVVYRTCHCNALCVYVLLTLFVVRFKQPLNWIITWTTPTNNSPFIFQQTTNNQPFTSTSMTKITFCHTIDYIRLTMLFFDRNISINIQTHFTRWLN